MTSQGGPGEDGRVVAITIKAVVLITIYAVYGVLQERIMKGHYDKPFSTNLESFDGKFSSAPFLVLCNRLVSLITGLLLVQLRPPTLDSLLPLPADSLIVTNLPPWLSRLKPASPLAYYARVAFLNNAATLSQYTSLAYLSFTTLTLGKSAKMVPILILGYVGYGKRYKQREWIGVTVIIFGIWEYLVLLPEVPMSETENKKAAATNWMGWACLLAYLFFDGLTSTTQERLFKKVNISKPLLLGLSGAVMDQMVRFKISVLQFADSFYRFG
jgi:drug/metabolite transporter (DMT)-like permease